MDLGSPHASSQSQSDSAGDLPRNSPNQLLNANDRFLANYKVAWIITSDKHERISPRTTREIA